MADEKVYIPVGKPAILKQLDDSNGNLTYKGNPIGGGGSDDAIKFPTNKGTNGQFLSTDGNNNVSWKTPSGGGGSGNILEIPLSVIQPEEEGSLALGFCEEYTPQDIYNLYNEGQPMRTECVAVYIVTEVENQEDFDNAIESYGALYIIESEGSIPTSVDEYEPNKVYYPKITDSMYTAQFYSCECNYAVKISEGANIIYEAMFSTIFAVPNSETYVFTATGSTQIDGAEISTYRSNISEYFYLENGELVLDETIVDETTFNASRQIHGTLYFVSETTQWVLSPELIEILTKVEFEKDYPNQNKIYDASIEYNSGVINNISVYADESHSTRYVYNHLLSDTKYKNCFVTIKAQIHTNDNDDIVKYLTLSNRKYNASTERDCEMHFTSFEMEGTDFVLYDLCGISIYPYDTPTWTFTKKVLT